MKQLMFEEYFSHEEVQKLEQELWEMVMKEVDIGTYTNLFNDLSTLCSGMVTPKYKKVERYIWGLPQPIQGFVAASKPSTYDIANILYFSLTNQEIYRNTMARKEDLPRVEDKKIVWKGLEKKG